MDRSMVAAQTFVLKTNIHCSGCEKKIKKLLQDIGGVHRISIDAVRGKIEISGTIDPHIVLKLLEKNGKKSELVWERMTADGKDEKIIRRTKSAAVNEYYGIHDKDVVSELRKLSEIKGLKSIEVNRDGMKITFNENEQESNGESETCSARKPPGKTMHKKYEPEYAMNNDCDCSRNEAMYKEFCDGCGRPTNCRCVASHGSVSQGIPWPGYNTFPSAPPVPEYYPPPAPPPHGMAYNHPFYSTFSDDNPRSCIIM
ncbi:HMA domain-containing protein [Heracleum sosnowskyi]|uniref:HMA domain-containing protein n=1 Tax=Heracleum sosnowskyi TaxID=360622 RepID=A0AAD8LZS2_9APIA|nr:HMA domain-containing protein [Heracleum sosnowskyi]